MLSRDMIVVRDDEPISTRIDGDVVMLSERQAAYFGLNEVGSRIWDNLSEPRRIGEICETLSKAYDATEETITVEVTRFLQELLARGLVRIVDDSKAVR